MSELLFVSVPGGTAGTSGPLLRVLIVPRLDGPTLARDGLEQWPPAALAGATLEVCFCARTDGEIVTVDVPPPHIVAQPGVWQTFFDPNTKVKPARARTKPLDRITVANTSEQVDKITGTFAAAAQADVRSDAVRNPQFDRAVRSELQTKWAGPEHARLEKPESTAPAKPQAEDDEVHFNRTLTMLKEHPAVLRALGLIFDVRLPSGLPNGISEGFVKIRVKGNRIANLPAFVSPWTQFAAGFLPSDGAVISAGMVRLDAPLSGDANRLAWDVVTVDVDNGAARLRDAARALATAATGEATDQANPPHREDATLPALRSTGLMLMRRGRQGDFDARQKVAAEHAGRESMNDAVFTASDLALGYRIDVKPEGQNDWFSLQQRSATYSVKKNGQKKIDLETGLDEEGHIKAHAAVEQHGALHADEIVARWDGWSLAVPRPDFDGGTRRKNIRRPGQHLSYEFDFAFALRGKLPRLRFSKSYSLRARVADVTGGGLQVTDPAAERCLKRDIKYRRYEPLASPCLAFPGGTDAKALGPGESIHMVVLRSDPGVDPAAFAQRNPAYHSSLVRLLHPPRTSLALAEQHGAFDEVDAEESWRWVERALAAAGDERASADSVLLPDYATVGITIFPRDEPGCAVALSMSDRAWEERWPELKPKQIELSERDLADSNVLSWVDSTETLNVRLAQAEQLTIEFSSRMKGDLYDHFEIKGLALSESGDKAVQQGRHPIVNPKQIVTFVHAVRRPLREPRGRMTCTRAPGETFARLGPEFTLFATDSNSTGQLEITASWKDWIDDDKPPVDDRRVQTIDIHREDTQLRDPLRHEFGDTKHRRITYTVTAVSRFRHFFDKTDPGPFVARSVLPHPERPEEVRIPSSARPLPPVLISTRPSFLWQDQPGNGAGVRRTRLAGRLRVELQRPWYQTGEGEQLGVVVWSDEDPPEAMWPFITQVARDPIFRSDYPHRFPNARAFAGSSPPREVFLDEAQRTLVVVPFDVSFAADRWIADIAMPGVAAASYHPFVQLALARYQADSLDKLALSSVIRSELVPLLPDRTVTVTKSTGGVVVRLDGNAPFEHTGAGAGSIVSVIVERLQAPPGTPSADVVLSALEPPTEGIPAWVSLPNHVHSGRVGQDIQVPLPPERVPLRLRIHEMDLRKEASENPKPSLGELNHRSVFVDVVNLD